MSKRKEPRSFALARLLWYAQREAQELGQAQVAALLDAALLSLGSHGMKMTRPLSATVAVDDIPIKAPRQTN